MSARRLTDGLSTTTSNVLTNRYATSVSEYHQQAAEVLLKKYPFDGKSYGTINVDTHGMGCSVYDVDGSILASMWSTPSGDADLL
jgi:hypothetical protein